MTIKTVNEIVVIWRKRKQNLQECTETFLIFLHRLKSFDIRYRNWYEGAYSREKALEKKIEFNYDYIKNRFCKNCDNNDFPEFTYKLNFWNGGETDALSLGIRVSIGGDGKVGNNTCTLTFPYEGEIYEYYRIRENWEQLLELFIDHWQPDQYRDFEDNLITI